MTPRTLISATDKDGGLDQKMDPRFGRAAGFLVIDGDKLEWIDNGARNAGHGAGVAAVALARDQNVEAVISGEFGPKANEGLMSLGVERFVAPEGITIRDALAQMERGELREME